MNACMYVCISMVLCSVSCLPLLFITLIVISHRFICDCILFSFDCEPFCLHLDSYWLCVCVAAWFLLFLLFLFAALYIFVHWTLFYLSSLSVTSLSVLLYAFWWCMLCLIVLFSVYFTSSSPYHPGFLLLFFFFSLVSILFYFLLYCYIYDRFYYRRFLPCSYYF